jgi:hypothetical protein
VTFEESLVAEILAIQDLPGLIGNRVYESTLPQKATVPAIVYHTTTEQQPVHLTGRGKVRTEVVSLDVITNSKATTRIILDRLQAHFFRADFRGVLGGGVTVVETTPQSVDSQYMRLNDGSDRAVRVATVSFSMRYSRP